MANAGDILTIYGCDTPGVLVAACNTGSGPGGTETLQNAYDDGTGVIALSAAGGGLLLNDTAGHLAPAFGVRDSTGATTYFSVTSSAITAGVNLSIASGIDIIAVGGAADIDYSASSGVLKTPTGTNTINGAVVFAANKGVTVTAGTSAFDFSGGSGAFKTSTGACTIGPGAVGISGAATLTSSFTQSGGAFAGLGNAASSLACTVGQLSLSSNTANGGGAGTGAVVFTSGLVDNNGVPAFVFNTSTTLTTSLITSWQNNGTVLGTLGIDGSDILIGAAATGGSTTKDSPSTTWQSHYWDGAASQTKSMVWQAISTGVVSPFVAGTCTVNGTQMLRITSTGVSVNSTNNPSIAMQVVGKTGSNRFRALGSAPTIAAGTGAGTGPTVSVAGYDTCGTISVTTGTTPAANATIVTVTVNTGAQAKNNVVLFPANAATAGLVTPVFIDDSAAVSGTFKIAIGAVALGGSSGPYLWYYHCLDQ